MKSNNKSSEHSPGAIKHARHILLSRAASLCRITRQIEEQLNADAIRALDMMEFAVNHRDAKAVYAHSCELLKQIDARRLIIDELDDSATRFERAIKRYEYHK